MLGDFFPEELKDFNADGQLEPGSVLRMHVPDTNPPKIKRFIIVAKDIIGSNLGTVFINSEINPKLFPTQELRELHLPLSDFNRTYLEKNSFVDCSDITIRNKEDLKAKLKNSPKLSIGRVSHADYSLIIEKLASATTISHKIKKQFNLV